MAQKWESHRGAFGIIQSAMPTTKKENTTGRAMGLSLRGVVVGVYAYDSDAGYAGGAGTDNDPVNTIYVDVMCYGNKYNGRLSRVVWTHDRSGVHDGEVTTPRPTKFDVQGDFAVDSGANPANWDGDHVIVSFLEDDLAQPYVSRCIPHPSSDIGNSDLAVGHRMRLQDADGRTRLWKHQGAVFGADKDGNWLVDLRRAHTGEYTDTGAEPAQAKDGSVGNHKVLVPEGSSFEVGITKGDQTADSQNPNPDTNTTSVKVENNKVTVKIDGGPPMTLELEGGDWKLTNTADTELATAGKIKLGPSAEATHPVIHGDTYQSDQTAKNTILNTHFSGITTLAALLPTAAATPVIGPAEVAKIPTLWAAILAFAQGLALTGTAAGQAVTDYDSAVPGQLSDDVTSK